jgi:tripartite-type tricarboxylate transporter receptor subunit TctC
MLKTPAVDARIRREGAIPIGSTPEQFAQRFKNEVEKWAKVAKSAGLAGAH